MKPILLFLLLMPLVLSAQRVVTLDPVKDPVARRSPEGTIQFVVPIRALTISIQESLPHITDIQTIGIQKIGKSNYIIASGKGTRPTETNVSVAILLAETAPDNRRRWCRK